MKIISRCLAIIVILSAIAIGLLLQGMLWRIEAVGFDWIAAILGLAAAGILVMAGLQYHYDLLIRVYLLWFRPVHHIHGIGGLS